MDATGQVTGRQDVPQMTVGNWLITLLLLIIPIVNIIMLIIWAFDSNSPRKNFSRAQLIIMGIGIALWILLAILMVIFSLSLDVF